MRAESGFQLTGSAPSLYDRVVAPIMAPFVGALLDAGHVGSGSAVLDVACGTGFAARAAAVRAGPAGHVAGVDINPGMLEVAASVLPAVEWHEASAGGLPFPDASFDAVVCQQGLQFVPDLHAAVAEAARVTRHGGRVAATVWSGLQRCPYFDAQVRSVEEVAGSQATASSLGGAFGCPADRVTAAFRAAGLRGVTGREVVADIQLPPLVEFAPRHLLVTPWGIAAAEACPDGVQLVTRSMAALLPEYTGPDGSVTAPFASLLVAGHR